MHKRPEMTGQSHEANRTVGITASTYAGSLGRPGTSAIAGQQVELVSVAMPIRQDSRLWLSLVAEGS